MNRQWSEKNAIDVLNLSMSVVSISIFPVRVGAYVLISKWFFGIKTSK